MPSPLGRELVAGKSLHNLPPQLLRCPSYISPGKVCRCRGLPRPLLRLSSSHKFQVWFQLSSPKMMDWEPQMAEPFVKEFSKTWSWAWTGFGGDELKVPQHPKNIRWAGFIKTTGSSSPAYCSHSGPQGSKLATPPLLIKYGSYEVGKGKPNCSTQQQSDLKVLKEVWCAISPILVY